VDGSPVLFLKSIIIAILHMNKVVIMCRYPSTPIVMTGWLFIELHDGKVY